ncbi:MAG: hypothetical protein OXG02_10750 [Chloroflexi bacterium]|nr:hypothetical protein [Chloroflexota bacterium]
MDAQPKMTQSKTTPFALHWTRRDTLVLLFDDHIPMTLPTEPGTYEFRLCVYESTSKERLIASEGEHNCVNLGDVHIVE